MTSRLNLAAPAVRPALKGRLLLAAPSGAGKTKSGLIIATVLAADHDGSIVVIDTEKESALTYADDFDFKHIPWRPPYDVAELAETITDAGRTFSVVMVDSMSHFWRKSGGTLDVAGGKFGGWKKARPLQEDLVDAILGCDAHVILCARSKQAHVQEEDERGRQVVKKLGMAAQQDDDLEYEMNIGCEIDMEHTIAVSKSRCDAVPVGRQFTAGHAGELAELYRDWLKVGEPPAPQAAVDALVARMNALPAEARKACKGEFVAKLGRPELLREARLVEADALVARFEAEGPHPDGPPSGQGPGPEPGPPPDTSGGEVDVPSQGPAASASPPEISELAPAPGSDDGTGGEAIARTAPSGAVTPAALLAATNEAQPGKAQLRVMRSAREVAQALSRPVPASIDVVVEDQDFAALVLHDLGGGAELPPVEHRPWKAVDEAEWTKWKNRCNAKAGPGTKAKPHPRLLDEDKAIYDEQRHALAWQASHKHRGSGLEVESWSDVTEVEARAIEAALELLKSGEALLTFDEGGRWVCQRKAAA